MTTDEKDDADVLKAIEDDRVWLQSGINALNNAEQNGHNSIAGEFSEKVKRFEEAESCSSMMKLDSEDYQNIYLRVREKLIPFFFGAIGITSFAGLIVLYFSITSATEKVVNKYVQTDSFRTSVTEDVASRLAQLEKREKELFDALKRAEKKITVLSDLPVAVSKKGVTLIGADGSKFHIETGQVKRGDTVTFSRAFDSPPTVLLTPLSDRHGRTILYNKITTREYSPLTSLKASTKGFKVHSWIRDFNEYSWVALGH